MYRKLRSSSEVMNILTLCLSLTSICVLLYASPVTGRTVHPDQYFSTLSDTTVQTTTPSTTPVISDLTTVRSTTEQTTPNVQTVKPTTVRETTQSKLPNELVKQKETSTTPSPAQQPAQQHDQQPVCGVNRFGNSEVPDIGDRIVGGARSFEGEFPWQVSIRLTHPNAGKVGHWCGGVLIDAQWVVTAAHCIINPLFMLPDAKYWEVRVGEYLIKQEDDFEQTYQVEQVFHYPLYKGYDNDIAVMKLVTPVQLNEHVSPICLPPLSAMVGNDENATVSKPAFEFDQCIATGWGKLDHNKKGSDVLQKVSVRVFDNSICQRAYYSKFKIAIRNWHLCAGTEEQRGGKGTCHGDSGGPLQCRVGSNWYLAGVTSFGSGCAKPGFPDVYTRITHFMEWINNLRNLY